MFIFICKYILFHVNMKETLYLSQPQKRIVNPRQINSNYPKILMRLSFIISLNTPQLYHRNFQFWLHPSALNRLNYQLLPPYTPSVTAKAPKTHPLTPLPALMFRFPSPIGPICRAAATVMQPANRKPY